MSFTAALDEIVKSQFRNEPARRAEWEKFEASNDLSILNKYCNRGRGPFETPESVLWYAMAYMYTHYEAARRAMSPLEDEFGDDYRPGVIDFGCGPVTSVLALSDLFRERGNGILSLSYLGIDTSLEMLRLGDLFSKRPDCFQQPPSSHFDFALSASQVSDEQLAAVANQASCIILSFNYILGQPLAYDAIRAFADVVCRIKLKAGNTSAWFLYTNAKGMNEGNLTMVRYYCCQSGVPLALPEASAMDHPIRRPRLTSDTLVTVSAPTSNLKYVAAKVW